MNTSIPLVFGSPLKEKAQPRRQPRNAEVESEFLLGLKRFWNWTESVDEKELLKNGSLRCSATRSRFNDHSPFASYESKHFWNVSVSTCAHARSVARARLNWPDLSEAMLSANGQSSKYYCSTRPNGFRRPRCWVKLCRCSIVSWALRWRLLVVVEKFTSYQKRIAFTGSASNWIHNNWK